MKTRQTNSEMPVRHKGMPKRTAATGKSARPDRPTGDGRASGRTQIDPVERYGLIARAAYFRAERRGFASGGELQDWLEAEAEIERLLNS